MSNFPTHKELSAQTARAESHDALRHREDVKAMARFLYNAEFNGRSYPDFIHWERVASLCGLLNLNVSLKTQGQVMEEVKQLELRF